MVILTKKLISKKKYSKPIGNNIRQLTPINIKHLPTRTDTYWILIGFNIMQVRNGIVLTKDKMQDKAYGAYTYESSL